MSRVVIRREVSPAEGVFKDVHPLLQRLYLSRGICSQNQISRELPDLLPYQDMLNIQEAAAELGQRYPDRSTNIDYRRL